MQNLHAWCNLLEYISSIAICSGGDQSARHSRGLKAGALQQVVELIQQDKYQAVVAEVPFAKFERAISETSGAKKQMLVF